MFHAYCIERSLLTYFTNDVTCVEYFPLHILFMNTITCVLKKQYHISVDST